MPEKFSQMSVGATETEEDAKKRQKRGGKGMMKVSENKKPFTKSQYEIIS